MSILRRLYAFGAFGAIKEPGGRCKKWSKPEKSFHDTQNTDVNYSVIFRIGFRPCTALSLEIYTATAETVEKQNENTEKASLID
nr:hypothetical protein HmN_000979700 [Hymenolepis microstoma]